MIMGIIVINAVMMGIQTSNSAMKSIGYGLEVLDWIVIGIFTLEILLKFGAYNYKYF